MTQAPRTICPGCKVALPVVDGATHDYMDSSPACYALFMEILAHEYQTPALLGTHRLTVDTYAVQHPGAQQSRVQIQSVGLHLARLGLQLTNPLPPKETNDVMLGLGQHKHTLDYIAAPTQFRVTVADVAPVAGTSGHADAVRAWAQATWEDWSDHHSYIIDWAKQKLWS